MRWLVPIALIVVTSTAAYGCARVLAAYGQAATEHDDERAVGDHLGTSDG